MRPVPNGWAAPWLYREGGDYDPARIVVDEPQYHATRGAVSTVVAEIDQGEASDALAAYIVALHNANVSKVDTGATSSRNRFTMKCEKPCPACAHPNRFTEHVGAKDGGDAK